MSKVQRCLVLLLATTLLLGTCWATGHGAMTPEQQRDYWDRLERWQERGERRIDPATRMHWFRMCRNGLVVPLDAGCEEDPVPVPKPTPVRIPDGSI